MNKALVYRKRTGIILALTGIVLSLLPALRLNNGTSQTIFQLLMNHSFMQREVVTAEYVTGIIILVILIYGLIVHILNLILWFQKKETTYIGVMGLSWASFLAMVMIGCIGTSFEDGLIAQFPFTIWQTFRIIIVLSEAIIKLSGEELFNIVLDTKK